MSYNYTDGNGLAALDKTTPSGATEPVSILDEAIRQVKAFLKDATPNGLQGLFNRVAAAETSISTLQAGNIPVGAIMDYAGSTAPAGWLICDGTAVSRTTFAELFNAIGITYGSGNGTTTFNIPDFRARVSIPRDAGANRVPDAAPGTFGGSEKQALTVAELPSHTHPYEDAYYAERFDQRPSGVSTVSVPSGYGSSASNNDNVGYLRPGTITSATGDGLAHNNMPPFLTIASRIIKT